MRLVFIGPPGAGKGTQAKLLREHYRIAHVSTGDMLRERIATGSATGLRAQPFVDHGLLVPDALMVEMVSERLGEYDAAAGFLLDGFPRTVSQARSLDAALKSHGIGLDAALLLNVPDDELVRRLSGRWTCSNSECGAVYNLPTHPPQVTGKCDRCGSELMQRQDDRPETIRTRVRKYHEKTAPVIEYYREQSLLCTVNGTGTVDQIQTEIRRALGTRKK